MRRQMTDQEVNRIVGVIDETTRDLFSLEHIDKPEGRAFRDRQPQDVRITRAKTRLRTAAWRKRNADLKRATADQVSRAILKALVTSESKDLVRSDYNLIGRALADLQVRGFDIADAKESMRRMRDQLMDPADRSGERTKTTAVPLTPSAWKVPDLVF